MHGPCNSMLERDMGMHGNTWDLNMGMQIGFYKLTQVVNTYKRIFPVGTGGPRYPFEIETQVLQTFFDSWLIRTPHPRKGHVSHIGIKQGRFWHPFVAQRDLERKLSRAFGEASDSKQFFVRESYGDVSPVKLFLTIKTGVVVCVFQIQDEVENSI